MACDICGKETKVYLTEMEGASIYVCSACNPSGQGKVIRQRHDQDYKPRFVRTKPNFVLRISKHSEDPFDLSNYELVENYAEQIRKLRESKNLNVEDFAKTLFVTASYLLKVEQGKLKPSAALLLKLYDKYGLFLVNKMPEKEQLEKKPFEPKIQRSSEPRRFSDNKRFERKFDSPKPNYLRPKEEKFVGTKEIYAPEEQNSEQKEIIETVNHNNKKKFVL